MKPISFSGQILHKIPVGPVKTASKLI